MNSSALKQNVLNKLGSQLALLGQPQAPLLLALSGGIDSVALLRLLHDSPFRERLSVLHVDHQLQANSQAWASFCAELCQQLKIPFSCEIVTLDGAQRRQQGLEAAARTARYQAAAKLATDAVLLTAHHAGDQLETLLMRLERGADVIGMAGMAGAMSKADSPWGMAQARPLLAVSKQALQDYLDLIGQPWRDDPSNTDCDIKRNYYRHKLVPQLPTGLATKLLLASEEAAEFLALSDARWPPDKTKHFQWQLLEPPHADSEGGNEVQRFVLKRWLAGHGVGLPKPRLDEVLRQLAQGGGRGQAPFYRCATYELWIRKQRLTVVPL